MSEPLQYSETIPVLAQQFKATACNGAVTLFVEAPRGQGRRHFLVAFGNLVIRIPVPDHVAEDHLQTFMMQKLETRLLDLLDRLTAPTR